MQRFADRPYSTWRTIEPSLTPYMSRLRSRRPNFIHSMKCKLDDVMVAFNPSEYADDRPLSGEYLLGYHCQRHALPKARAKDEGPDNESQH